MTQAMRTARGSAPMPWAMERQIGAISAVVAVLDMKFVITQHSSSTTKVSRYGEGFAPSRPITLSAIIWPAPVLCRAEARDSVPPKRKMVLRSMDLSASRSEMTPVSIRRIAPMQPVTASLMPIWSSKIMPSRVTIRMTRERTFFHLGTLLKSLTSSNTESPLSLVSWFGRSLKPIVA